MLRFLLYGFFKYDLSLKKLLMVRYQNMSSVQPDSSNALTILIYMRKLTVDLRFKWRINVFKAAK